MKKQLLLLLCLILSVVIKSSAQELFIVNDATTNTERQKAAITRQLANSSNYKNYFVGTINREILKSSTLNITIPNYEKLQFQKLEKYSDDEIWEGETPDKQGRFIIAYSSTGFYGTIVYKDRTYQLSGLDKTNCILAEVKPFCDGGCKTGEVIDYGEEEVEGVRPASVVNTTSSSCKLRVLVAYTKAVQDNVPDINSKIKLAIAETNRTYRNSNINHELELAGIIRYNSSENGDAWWDLWTCMTGTYVPRYRNALDADVVVLVQYKLDDLCGFATEIQAREHRAYCIVDQSCLLAPMYTFGHEIGHLQGARHDIQVDNSNNPYGYGHGYISPNHNWRTMMAYSDYCSGCSRVEYWSNPNVLHPVDGLPMGDAGYADNARVLNSETRRLKEFRTSPDVNDYDIEVRGYEIHNVLAKSKIIYSSNVRPNGELNLTTYQEVVLSEGLNVEVGGTLTINTNVSVCD